MGGRWCGRRDRAIGGAGPYLEAPLSVGSMQRFAWLDLVRFLAAMAVVLMHARADAFVPFGSLPPSQQNPLVAAGFALTRVGNEAVIAFFVLSGFLVGGRTFERTAGGSFRAADYAIDRASRILVPLIPALVLSVMVGWVVDRRVEPLLFVGNLLSLQGVLLPVLAGNAPLWSLGYEMWFYILAGCACVVVSRRRMDPLSAVLIAVGVWLLTRTWPELTLCWVIGAIGYLRRPSRPSPWLALAGLLIACFGIAGTQLDLSSATLPLGLLRPFVMPLAPSRLAIAAGATLLIQQLVLHPPRRGWAVGLEAVATPLAAFSYTLYLTHFPLLRLLRYLGMEHATSLGVASIGIYAGAVLCCIAVAWGMSLVFEQNTPRVRAALRRASGRDAALPAMAPGSTAGALE